MDIMRSSQSYALCKVSYVDWIVVNGFYHDFKQYCTTHPKIKSRNRLAYCFLLSVDLLEKYEISQKLGVQKLSDLFVITSLSWC